jgi:hypothetical protein
MSPEPPGTVRFAELAGGWTVAALPLLENLPLVRHAVSTRRGPDGASVAWDHPHGPANRAALARAIGAARVAALRQVHGGAVVDADEALAGEVQADAMFTRRQDVALLGQSADCPIILAANVGSGALGMAHASWRSTVQRITYNLIRAMCEQAGAEPGEIVAGICPSAGPCCYQVGPDTQATACAALGPAAHRFFEPRDGRIVFDLWQANVQQMLEAGMCRHNIQVAGVCTICDERFFSVRREGSPTGRFGALIARA